MIVVDSSVWIDFLKDTTTPQVTFLRSHPMETDFIVGDLVLLEVLRGARDHAHAAKLQRALGRFTIVPMMSPEVAVEGARIYRELRAEGITIRKTVDIAIATFCILNNHALLQSDRDFLPIAERFGLRFA